MLDIVYRLSVIEDGAECFHPAPFNLKPEP